MPPIIQWSSVAETNLNEIVDFYLTYIGEEAAIRAVSSIITKIEQLADTPMLKRRVEGIENDYQQWLVLNNKYRVYFRRLDKNAIKVVMIRNTKRRPPSVQELRKADKN